MGRLLDDERALARAHRPLARVWVCGSGAESARSALLRSHRVVLAWSPILQHLARLLHRGVPPTSADSTDPIRRAAGSDHDRMLCLFSAARPGVAMDAGGAAGWAGDRRLCMGDLAFRRAAFRRSLTLPLTRWPRCLRAFLSQTFSPERSPIRTSGSIAGSSPRGWCRRRTPSAIAPLWCS